MGQSYEKNKIHIYNNRAKNTIKYNEYMKNIMKKRYIWLTIKKEFLNILIL